MRHPIEIVKIIAILLFLLLFFLSAAISVRAADEVTLVAWQQDENPNFTRIIFTFSALPKFEMNHSGQRIDLLLAEVALGEGITDLPESERIANVMLAAKKKELLVSVLLRRHPQQIETSTKQNPPQVIMDIAWQADDSSRPAVAFRISDMPPRKAGRRAAKQQQESPWEGRWNDFFREYRTYWELDLPLNFTLPKLPMLITATESPLLPLQQHADNNMFLSLIQTATELRGLEQPQIYLRDLLLVEAQLRTGATEAAIARLDVLRRMSGDESVRVEYLTAYGQALDEQPYVAFLTLQKLLPQVDETDSLLPLVQLLIAETALAIGKDQVALTYLLDPQINWPSSLQLPQELRLADAYAGLDELAKAIAIYHDLIAEPGLFAFYRFSQNRAGISAFKHGDYKFSSTIFRQLIDPFVEESGDDLLLFAAGISAYEAGDMGWGMIGLDRVTLDRPETEGGDRGMLRLIDHKLVNGGELELAQAVTAYGKLGIRSQFYPVREEGRFKSALALFMLGDHAESVKQLMQFRREFRSSPLLREVDALVLKQLPMVIHELLLAKDDLQAVVLAEQNRKLLLRSGFDKEFLGDLATAFGRLGLYERSSRVLLYLLDRTAGKAAQQHIYLPLTQSYIKRQEYRLASQYARSYLEKYPQGEDAGALFGILLDAFVRNGSQEELLQWLQRKNRPSSTALEIRAANIYWQQGDMQRVVESLEKVYQAGGVLQVKEMALLAEAYYQLKKNKNAIKIYRDLDTDPDYAVQSRYRTAQILFRQGQRQAAIVLLKQVVESSGQTRWGKLAQDLLIEETH